MDKDTIAVVISLVSLVVSIILAVYQINTNFKMNKVNIKYNACEKIFDNYLIKEIPDKRRLLKFDKTGKLTGANELKNIIVDMIKDSLYFRYNDKPFYDNLIENLQQLEDFIVNSINKKYDSVRQCDFYNNIEKFLSEIYKIIEDKKIKG